MPAAIRGTSARIVSTRSEISTRSMAVFASVSWLVWSHPNSHRRWAGGSRRRALDVRILLLRTELNTALTGWLNPQITMRLPLRVTQASSRALTTSTSHDL